LSSPEDVEERKLSRRRFLKWAGAVAVVGAVGLELGAAGKGLLGQNGQKPAGDPSQVTETSTSTTTSTATETETDILADTETVTVTQVATETATETVSAPTTSNVTSPASQAGTPPAANSFSIFWITDTQFLSESNPALFKMMNNWIVSNWTAYNGKLVIHTGDMVQTGDVQQEWENANDAMTIFHDNDIPYTWCAGNHDDWVLDDETSGWAGNLWGTPAFDPVAYSSLANQYLQTKWVDDFHAGMNTALTFKANGLDFLVVNIEWNADPTVLKWVEGILADPAYAGHNAILAPHAYIDAYGETDDARWGPTLANFVAGLTPMMEAHPNVFLTLNGHFATDSGYNTPTPVGGVNSLMFDRQDCCDNPGDTTGRGVDTDDSTTRDADKVGGATVTILNFDTDNNQIHVSTYDVYTGQWRVEPANQYTVTMFPNPPASGGMGAAPRPHKSLPLQPRIR